jgi:hypothetical protein
MYIGTKIKGKFHHSSFLSGGAAISAGAIAIEDGELRSIKPHSGHYMPTCEEFKIMLDLLHSWGVDMSSVTIG